MIFSRFPRKPWVCGAECQMKTALIALVLLLVPFLCVRSAVPQQSEIPRNSVPQNFPCSNQPKSLKEVTAAFDKGHFDLSVCVLE